MLCVKFDFGNADFHCSCEDTYLSMLLLLPLLLPLKFSLVLPHLQQRRLLLVL